MRRGEISPDLHRAGTGEDFLDLLDCSFGLRLRCRQRKERKEGMVGCGIVSD